MKAGQLSAFPANDLTSFLQEAKTIRNGPQTVTIKEKFHQKIEQEWELDTQARRSFRHAVAQVRKEVGSLPHGEANVWMEFLERMLRCADLGHGYGWYQEKLSGIRTYVSDLSRRKNRNHPSFRGGLDYIYSNLSFFSPPTTWRERPAIVSTQELDRCGVA